MSVSTESAGRLTNPLYIANPASFMWLTESHPIATSEGCENVDEYKYGLSGGFPGYATSYVNALGRDGIVSKYRARQTHYAWGLVSLS